MESSPEKQTAVNVIQQIVAFLYTHYTALYPSLVIAYNFCYTTIAGKLDYHTTRQEMLSSGRTTSKIGPQEQQVGAIANAVVLVVLLVG